MLITIAQPISCGNAVRLVIQPTVSEARWRVLRKETNSFSGAMDSSAYLVHDGNLQFLTDSRLLTNGTPYFYAVYGEVSTGVWGAPVQVSVTPSALFTDLSVDAQEMVRERLDMALVSMIQRSQIVLTTSVVPVMSIPFYQQGGSFPVVTVLYGNGASVARAVGDEVMGWDGESIESGAQGWLSGVTLEITAWSLNADERNVLRRALQTAIAANLWIFEEEGLHTVEVQSVQDTEDFQSMNSPIYQTAIRLSCTVVVAASLVDGGDFVDVYPVLIGV